MKKAKGCRIDLFAGLISFLSYFHFQFFFSVCYLYIIVNLAF
jgi:hypothetical protein